MFDPLYTYGAYITKVVDGDTFKALVDCGFSIQFTNTFRVYGLDTPETFRPSNEAEREHGKQATATARDLLLHTYRYITTHRGRQGKYGRYLADVLIPLEDIPEAFCGDLIIETRTFADKTGVSYAELMRTMGFQKQRSYPDL